MTENKAVENVENEKNILKEKNWNLNAKPFKPTNNLAVGQQNGDFVTVGPSKVPVNAKIWNTIVSPRRPPEIQPIYIPNPYVYPIPSSAIGVASFNNYVEYPNYVLQPPALFKPNNRKVMLLHREFGPVSTNEGVELRLEYGVSVFISLEGAVRLEMGNIRVSISADRRFSAVEHPNGRIYQEPNNIDIVAVDGEMKNNFVRYARVKSGGIAFTAGNCALTYFVDSAGTRTTSERIIVDWRRDYCQEVYRRGLQMYNPHEVEYAAKHYMHKVEDDKSQVFTICGVRVKQAEDGMVRCFLDQAARSSIRASFEKRSLTLETPLVYCTASMGATRHLFIRIDNRRIFFDGINFEVRNSGHISSFDEQNLLHISK